MGETQATSRGIFVPCPKCNEQTANISFHLDDGETFTCRDCEEEFSMADVTEYVANAEKWNRVLKWAGALPTV